jgi:hypothetical protein
MKKNAFSDRVSKASRIILIETGNLTIVIPYYQLKETDKNILP